MSQQDYAMLAMRYAIWLLYNKGSIDGSSAHGCNLGALLQEGLGNHDEDPQVPLDKIVALVKSEMEESFDKTI